MSQITRKTWWWLSAAISVVFIVVLIGLWKKMNEYTIDMSQLTNETAADEYISRFLKDYDVKNNSEDENSVIRIKTGLFIQSLSFSSFSEVNLSGYFWQRYEKWQLEALDLKEDEFGLIFPEQIDSGSDIEPRLAYSVENKGGLVKGWYFEATLRQAFDYTDYPFDHKTVWVRMWPKRFSQNIILVPDYAAYTATGHTDVFGIENDIVLGQWERENTYFDYKLSSYTTDFGIRGNMGKDHFPELYYNFVVKRKFENAFIIYLLPLFLVAVLLFTALLTVSDKEELSSRLGFDTSGFIGVSSALFFVVMLAHIQLREQFAGSGIVYIEYFYILMYALLVAATANVYFFSIRVSWWGGIISYNDNIIPKVAYWPVVSGSLILITLFLL